jgi:transposase-like protein
MGDGQHFLLSAEARTLSLARIFTLSDDAAFQELKRARWHATDGNPVCCHCGGYQCYEISTRRIWKCSQCRRQFSVTSGTIFASRKLSFQKMLAAVALFVNAVKGKSMLEMSRDLGVQYKTAFVLCHKLREAVTAVQNSQRLGGDGQQAGGEETSDSHHAQAVAVEMDAAFFGGKVRQENLVADRKDRRLAQNQNGKQRAVLVMRERKGHTVAVAIADEVGTAVQPAVRHFLRPGTEVFADENAAYNGLRAYFGMRRVNHKRDGFSVDGACTNQAESFFSRLRRAEFGQHHHFSAKYLGWYAGEMAFREDTRRYDNKTIWERILQRALNHPVSRNLAGYWQGIHPPGEMLWNPT